MAIVLFKILAARLYRAFMKIIGDRGVLISIADDVDIACPPSTLAEIDAQLPALTMTEAGQEDPSLQEPRLRPALRSRNVDFLPRGQPPKL